jgi:VWFA-related protein
MEDQSNPFVADETQFNIFNTDRKLSAIESVGKLFAGFPEKKFLVHFSSGIETTGTENQSQLRSTVNALNQANTSLYTVDARGLIAAPPGGDASQGSASGNANYSGRTIRNQMASISGSQETLTTLALDTGGRRCWIPTIWDKYSKPCGGTRAAITCSATIRRTRSETGSFARSRFRSLCREHA